MVELWVATGWCYLVQALLYDPPSILHQSASDDLQLVAVVQVLKQGHLFLQLDVLLLQRLDPAFSST